MKLEQARSRVLDLWIAERDDVVNHDDYVAFFQSVRLFYDTLIRNNTEVLAFNFLGDKWQMVNRWIYDYENNDLYNSIKE